MTHQKIRIIGAPWIGQPPRRRYGALGLARRGSASAHEAAGASGEDIGNISVKQPEEMSYGEKRASKWSKIAETCQDLATATEKSLEEGFLPVVLGGDHSIAVGVAAGVANFFRKRKRRSATCGSTRTAI